MALAAGGATLFDDTGAAPRKIPVDASWTTLDVLPDGPLVVRDRWLAFTVQVVEDSGDVTEEWGTCAGGPNFQVARDA